MSFLIAVHVNEGIVLASDRRTTYSNTVEIEGNMIQRIGIIEEVETAGQGATWDGETLTLTRLLKPVALNNANGEYIDLPCEDILWGYFTLQDAIDFARFETTIQTMRFKNVVETVGGEVDILVIKPDETVWLQKAELV